MTEEQFRILLENRQLRRPLRIDELSPKAQRGVRAGRRYLPPLGALVQTAARQVRQREAAAEAWVQLARPEWLDYTRVLGVANGVVEIGVAHATVLYDIRRQKPALERRLQKVVAGMRGVRFVMDSGAEDEPPEAMGLE